MIIQETFDDYIKMVKTFSSEGKMIRSKSDGCLYDEAYDPEHLHREYEETDVEIGNDEEQ